MASRRGALCAEGTVTASLGFSIAQEAVRGVFSFSLEDGELRQSGVVTCPSYLRTCCVAADFPSLSAPFRSCVAEKD